MESKPQAVTESARCRALPKKMKILCPGSKGWNQRPQRMSLETSPCWGREARGGALGWVTRELDEGFGGTQSNKNRHGGSDLQFQHLGDQN